MESLKQTGFNIPAWVLAALPCCSERLTFDLCSENESSGPGHAVRVAILIQTSALDPRATLTRTRWQNRTIKGVCVCSVIDNKHSSFCFPQSTRISHQEGKTDWAGPFTFKGHGIEDPLSAEIKGTRGWKTTTLGNAANRRKKLFWCTSVNSQCQKQQVRGVTMCTKIHKF